MAVSRTKQMNEVRKYFKYHFDAHASVYKKLFIGKSRKTPKKRFEK